MAESMSDINDPAKIAARKAALAKQTAASKPATNAAAPVASETPIIREVNVSIPSVPVAAIIVPLAGAFLFYVIGRTGKPELPPAQTLGAWAVLAIVLAGAYDLGQPDIAKALAFAIFLGVVFAYGDKVAEWAASISGTNTKAPQTTRIPSGRYAGKEIPL